MKWVGTNLKRVAKEAGFTQADLADKLEVSRPTIISWMKDQVPKGIELMKLCQLLQCSPAVFFENDISFSFPKHRLVAHAKKTNRVDEDTIALIKDFENLFVQDFSEPLQLAFKFHSQSDPIVMAQELRKIVNITESKPLKLQAAFNLAAALGIFVIPIAFPEELAHKTSAFYTLYNDCNKVIFVNNKINYLDLVYFILHEICHALSNSEEIEEAEERFCEESARAVQFPKSYISKVFSQIKGRSVGITINLLKKLSVENDHSLYGLAKELDHYYGTSWTKRIGGANCNLNKTLPDLKTLLIDDSVRNFLHRFSKISPLFFEKIILKSYNDLSDRKLCELLGLDDIIRVSELREELERCANASQAGCTY